MDFEETMEQDWGPAFAHESGHALMALLQGIPCRGIYFERGADGGRFCALLADPSDKQSNKDYLVSAAGVAAELLVYPNRNSDGAEADRADFGSSGGPSFEEIVDQARLILSGEMVMLEKLISILKARVSSVDFDLSSLPEVRVNGDGNRYLTLLSEEELETAVRGS
jgi:hypothetical protein